MKQFLIVGIALFSLNAFANQATDSIRGQVRCKAENGTIVVISSSRSVLTITKPGQAPETYRVSQTVGDTETYYSPNSGNPSLSFNDQGDYIQFTASENGVSLSCPQGQDQQ